MLLSLYKVFLNLTPTSSLRSNFLKVKDRETEEERRTMYFQIAVNLVCLFSYVNHMYIFIYIFAGNHVTQVCTYLLHLPLSGTPFVCTSYFPEGIQ